jgi:hypothetical protein
MNPSTTINSFHSKIRRHHGPIYIGVCDDATYMYMKS